MPATAQYLGVLIQYLALNPALEEHHELAEYEIPFIKILVGIVGLGVFSYYALILGEYLGAQLNSSYLSDRLGRLAFHHGK